ncbi:hypothetical protein VUN82_09375 [Micrococcaceae bacterium Sec5.1]
MIRVLMYVYLLLFGYGLSWGGRHRMAIKPGAKGEIGFEAVHLAFLVAAAAIVFALPPMTSFRGLPALAYAAFAALLVSLVTYGLKPLRREHPSRKSMDESPTSKVVSKKWPQSVAWGVGHGLALLYLASIAQYMFG